MPLYHIWSSCRMWFQGWNGIGPCMCYASRGVKAGVHIQDVRPSVIPRPDNTVFEKPGASRGQPPGATRACAYIGQVHSRQRVAEVDEHILYGANPARYGASSDGRPTSGRWRRGGRRLF